MPSSPAMERCVTVLFSATAFSRPRVIVASSSDTAVGCRVSSNCAPGKDTVQCSRREHYRVHILNVKRFCGRSGERAARRIASATLRAETDVIYTHFSGEEFEKLKMNSVEEAAELLHDASRQVVHLILDNAPV